MENRGRFQLHRLGPGGPGDQELQRGRDAASQQCLQHLPGNDKYRFLYDVNGTIYGYNETTGEGERLFAWLDCDINSDTINQFTVRSDGSVLALENQYSEEEMRNIYNLITIKQVDASTVPQKETLTLACMYLDWNLKSEIVDFNRSQDKVRIQVVDYSQYNTDDNYDAGLQKLGTEILSVRCRISSAPAACPWTSTPARASSWICGR